VTLVVSDDHEGLQCAIAELLPEVYGERCDVAVVRKALDKLPHKPDNDGLVVTWKGERVPRNISRDSLTDVWKALGRAAL